MGPTDPFAVERDHDAGVLVLVLGSHTDVCDAVKKALGKLRIRGVLLTHLNANNHQLKPKGKGREADCERTNESFC